MDTKLNFASDYTRTAHPAILSRLAETAGLSMPGYGTDLRIRQKQDTRRM